MAASPGRVQHAGVQRPARPAGHRRPGFLSAELLRRENAVTLRRLRAAILRGLRPTTLIQRVQPNSAWDDLDYELFEAFDVLERETSSSHGLPRWLSTTTDNSVGIEVDTYTDVADAALDDWDDKHQGKKKKPGVVRYAVPVSLTGEEIEGGLARERLIQQQADLEEDDLVEEYGLDIDRKAKGGEYDPADYG